MITSRQLQISKHHAGRSLIFGRVESAVAPSNSDSLSGAFHAKLESTAESKRTIISQSTIGYSRRFSSTPEADSISNTIILRREIYETRPVEEDV